MSNILDFEAGRFGRAIEARPLQKARPHGRQPQLPPHRRGPIPELPQVTITVSSSELYSTLAMEQLEASHESL